MRPGGRADAVIEFRNVGKTYRSVAGLGRTVRAVDGVTLTIGQGEVVGLAGPNGAGKTTLIAMMLGYLQPSDGDVRIAGQAPRAYVERHGIGYLSELIAIRQHWKAEGALRRFGILSGIPEENLGPRVSAVITRLGLEEHRDKRIKALSKGNLQRVGLAQALLQEDASVMVLDEPTHGLDPVWTQRFRDVVGELRAPGRAIFIASHNLDELERLCDRVAIIDHGQLQRVVTMRGLDRSTPATSFTITMVSGADQVPSVFPGAESLGHGEFRITVSDHAMLNRGIADLLNRGALLASVTPSQSSLEQQFRQAVGE